MGTNETLSGVIAERMEQSGVSLRGLALVTGIPMVTLHRRLADDSKATYAELQHIADALDAPLSQLVREVEKRRQARSAA
jgi:transcriptional regulator with XRE-family HTH domain